LTLRPEGEVAVRVDQVMSVGCTSLATLISFSGLYGATNSGKSD
jgi:hypothetical protein